MNNWFTVKVKYTKQLDNGALKRVSEPYLLAAMTFTDAEARIYEELGQIIRGEFNVVGITRTEIHDIFAYDDVDLWYKVKIKYESADADSEKAKKVTQNFLVSANSVKEAYERIKESLSTLLVDFEIPSIMVSPIVEIFPYAENLDKEISRTPIEKVEVEEEEEDNSSKGGGVFSSSGSDVDDEDENSDEDEDESEIEDSTDED
ncbi:MAG: DUF4494 domain-containing protein [Crocinitomicaceae bacterium]|jgi:hypothetical protein|nr:DUF4494 domain-containing protein [Crocinitomicaceae bacterium]|tara:strand:- start:18260 stop:18871 length:612 start_codon:yes stop_codon:yes gene_type:complete